MVSHHTASVAFYGFESRISLHETKKVPILTGKSPRCGFESRRWTESIVAQLADAGEQLYLPSLFFIPELMVGANRFGYNIFK